MILGKPILIRDETHWHELRSSRIGGSDVAALFGVSPYQSHFELFQRKHKGLPEKNLDDNQRILWGKFLEPAIAEGAGKLNNWTVKKSDRYWTDDSLRLGGTPDFDIIDGPKGLGVLEIKTVDSLVFKKWPDGEPPAHMILQLMTYLALTNRKWGAICALVGGNDLLTFIVERRESTIDLIEEKTRAFWDSIRDGVPPPPDYLRDSPTINAIHANVDRGKVIDLSHNERAVSLVETYVTASSVEWDVKREKKAARSELLTILGPAEVGLVGERTVKSTVVTPKTGEPYRKLRIVERTM